MTIFEEENERIYLGEKPVWLVCTGRLSYPCITKETAEMWREMLVEQGIKTVVLMDLTYYDWDENIMKFSIRQIAEIN